MYFPTHESQWPRLKWTSFLLVYCSTIFIHLDEFHPSFYPKPIVEQFSQKIWLTRGSGFYLPLQMLAWIGSRVKPGAGWNPQGCKQIRRVFDHLRQPWSSERGMIPTLDWEEPHKGAISNWREAGNANELGHNCALTISATGWMKGGKGCRHAMNLQLGTCGRRGRPHTHTTSRNFASGSTKKCWSRLLLRTRWSGHDVTRFCCFILLIWSQKDFNF